MPTRLVDKRISQRKIGASPKRVLISAVGGRAFVSGSHKVHVFTSTDTFQVLYKATGSNLTWQYFLVGGGQSGDSGAGGSGKIGGNGGAGGQGTYKTSSAASFDLFNTRNVYTITVGGAGSPSTITNNSTTITSAGGLTPGGGTAGQGEQLGDDDGSGNCPPDVEGTAGGNGGAPVGSSIIFNGPYTSYCAGGGGGGGAGGNNGGQSGRTGPDGDGGYGGDAGTNNATAGTNALINSGDGGGGGGGGSAYCTSPPPSQPGGAGGAGGSGIVFIKYQFEE